MLIAEARTRLIGLGNVVNRGPKITPNILTDDQLIGKRGPCCEVE